MIQISSCWCKDFQIQYTICVADAGELLKSEQVSEELNHPTDDSHKWKQERITQVGVLCPQPLLEYWELLK